jgi:hypothetical protein
MESDATSPVLASLHSLRYLSVPALEDEELPQEAFWTQLTALTELQLDCGYDYDYQSIPAGLGGMTGLRKLTIIQDGDPVELPVGLYLSRLESLVMQGCDFSSGLPATLAAATQLRHLDISKSFSRGLFVLTAADVAVLSALPALTMLHLWELDELDEHGWDDYLAQLQAAFLAQGRARLVVSVGG